MSGTQKVSGAESSKIETFVVISTRVIANFVCVTSWNALIYYVLQIVRQ